jgi:hypothetical protein
MVFEVNVRAEPEVGHPPVKLAKLTSFKKYVKFITPTVLHDPVIAK